MHRTWHFVVDDDNLCLMGRCLMGQCVLLWLDQEREMHGDYFIIHNNHCKVHDVMAEDRKNLLGQPFGPHRILGVLPFFAPTCYPGKCVKNENLGRQFR